MTLLEKVIEKTAQRVKRMEIDPAPGQLHSDLLGAKIDLAEYISMNEAWKVGKPFLVWQRSSLTRGLGFQPVTPPSLLMHCPEEVPGFRKKAELMEMPAYSCDHVLMTNVAFASGQVPMPSVILTASGGCPVTTYGYRALEEFYPDTPRYTLDYPLVYSEENITFMADQFREFAEFAEKYVPGAHYDEERLIRYQEADAKGLEYIRQDWDLRRRKPFPMSVEAGLAGGNMPFYRLPSQGPDIDKSLEFWRVRIEELTERADKMGEEELANQKLRVMWVWGPPHYVQVNDILKSMGVIVPTVQVGPTPYYNGRKPGFLDRTEFGRKLTPLEEEARMLLGYAWRQCGTEWVDEAIHACKDLDCDAIIISQFHDCISTASLSRLIADRAENELGIPALIINTKIYDEDVLPSDQYRAELKEFLEMVLAMRS